MRVILLNGAWICYAITFVCDDLNGEHEWSGNNEVMTRTESLSMKSRYEWI